MVKWCIRISFDAGNFRLCFHAGLNASGLQMFEIFNPKISGLEPSNPRFGIPSQEFYKQVPRSIVKLCRTFWIAGKLFQHSYRPIQIQNTLNSLPVERGKSNSPLGKWSQRHILKVGWNWLSFLTLILVREFMSAALFSKVVFPLLLNHNCGNWWMDIYYQKQEMWKI